MYVTPRFLSISLFACLCATACDTGDAEPTNAPGSLTLGSRSYFVLPANGNQVFPTYLAHLIGKDLAGTTLRVVQPISISNTSANPRTVTIRVSIPGYAVDGVTTVSIAGGQTSTVDVQPQLTLPALYALTAPVSTQVVVRAEESGTPIASATDTVMLAPRNTVFWGFVDGDALVDLRAFVAAFVMPNDPDDAVQTLLTEAAGHSPMGSMVGYQYDSQLRSETTTIPVGGWLLAYPTYRAGQTVSIDATLYDCANCQFYPSIALLSPSQCDDWLEGGSEFALRSANVTDAGASFSATLTESGRYCIVAGLTGQTGIATISIERNWGLDEGARTELAAIFDALHARGLVYVNVPGSFFDGSQNVKLPAQSLGTGSSNCIDGTLLFASALEALGMEPGIVIVPGHAFVAVAPYPGAPFSIFLETTMVASGDSDSAFEAAEERYWAEAARAITSPWTMPLIINVAKARELGLTPMPF